MSCVLTPLLPLTLLVLFLLLLVLVLALILLLTFPLLTFLLLLPVAKIIDCTDRKTQGTEQRYRSRDEEYGAKNLIIWIWKCAAGERVCVVEEVDEGVLIESKT